MATQLGYGKVDTVGSPFDFYSGATSVTASAAYIMQNNSLVLNPAGAVTGVTVTLPANAPDGAVAEVTNAVGSGGAVTLTISPATSYNGTGSTVTAPFVVSDAIVGTAVSAQSTAAGVTYRYKYSLTGDNRAGINPRSWIRVL